MISASRVAFFHTASRLLSASSSPLYKLRQRTGLAYNLCREALDKHSNDIEQAEVWLKAQALARGLQKATKVGSRNTREGLISITIPKQNKLVTILELNCETDFVARNQTFKDLVIDLGEQVSESSSSCITEHLSGQKHIGMLKLSDLRLKEIEQQIAPLVVKLGENIKLGRAYHLSVLGEEDIKLFGQIHAQAAQKNTERSDIFAGRFGAIVALRHPQSMDHESLRAHGNRLCQHVIGYSPTYIELPDNIRKQLEEAEREQLAKIKSEEENKDEAEEEYSDQEDSQTFHHSRDDWPSIMDQTLIMSNDVSVRDFCKAKELSIVHFNRFECGVLT